MMPPATAERTFFRASASLTPQCVLSRLLFPGGAFPQELGDIEVDEIGVMKNNRFNRPLDLVSLVTVSGDHMHDFCRNAVLVGESDAAEWMSKLLAELSLNHFSGRVFVILERLADVGQNAPAMR